MPGLQAKMTPEIRKKLLSRAQKAGKQISKVKRRADGSQSVCLGLHIILTPNRFARILSRLLEPSNTSGYKLDEHSWNRNPFLPFVLAPWMRLHTRIYHALIEDRRT